MAGGRLPRKRLEIMGGAFGGSGKSKPGNNFRHVSAGNHMRRAVSSQEALTQRMRLVLFFASVLSCDFTDNAFNVNPLALLTVFWSKPTLAALALGFGNGLFTSCSVPKDISIIKSVPIAFLR